LNCLDFFKSRESNISIHGETQPPLGDAFENYSTGENNLRESIRAAFEVSVGKEKKEFLPLGALEKIITSKRVRRKLGDLGVVSLGEVRSRLCHRQDLEDILSFARYQNGRRKTFAILALIEKWRR
jgi:hypothetical protein